MSLPYIVWCLVLFYMVQKIITRKILDIPKYKGHNFVFFV